MGKVIQHHHTLEFVEILVIDQLRRSLRQKNHPFRHMVVSTAGDHGAESRMVVMRELDHNPFVVSFHTDIRSGKIAEIESSHQISLLFWHPTARLQVRLKAVAVLHHNNEYSKARWKLLGDASRQTYIKINAPGTAYPGDLWEASSEKDGFSDANFAVVTSTVQEMDVLQLSREGHIRAQILYDQGKRMGRNFVEP